MPNRKITKRGKIRIGITMGDPSGIGPAIALKAINELKGLAEFIIIGDDWVLRKAQSSKSKIQNYRCIDLNNVNRKEFAFGRIKAEYGKASIEYIDKALELIESKEMECLVTAPISKEAVGLAGYLGFSGHTEYLAKRSQTEFFVMMLLNNELRFSLVTRHIPLEKVSSQLCSDIIYKTILVTHQSLKSFFSILNPRIVVCGLNPHASDNGLIGKEENRIIKPALNKLRNVIKYIDGPISSDVAIKRAKEKRYDCVIAMYHDQALIPLKLLDDANGVNITLGLPFIRTSPLHGTAFDISGNFSQANPSSLIAAVNLAVKCALNIKPHG